MAIVTGYLVQMIGGEILPVLYLHLRDGGWPRLYYSNSYAGRFFHSVYLSIFVYVLFISKKLKWPLWPVLDRFMIAAMLMSGIGRIGCFLQGCCGGKPSNLPWCIRFPSSTEYVHPTQLYMMATEIFLFALLFFVQKKQKYAGFTFWLGVFLYCIYRFLIEYLRVNPIAYFGLTHAQIFSLFMAVLAAIMLFRKK